MQRNLAALILAALILAEIVIGGCSGDDPFDPDKPRRGPATGVAGQLAPVDQEGQPLGQRPVSPPPPPEEQSQNANVPPPPPPPNTVQEEAQPGVTGKGQDYGTGPIVTPVAIYFSIRERVVFNIQIPQALKLYKGLQGHAPKTHDEFMEKVIKANGIALPELPQDHRYLFDPETQELMVERPR